jgi:MFS transporter, YNFM family, putative membrane transport protein
MAIQRICDPMLPELSRVFEAPIGDTAQVVSMFAITYGLMQFVFGPIGDRWGKYKVVTLATLGCCAGSVLSALSEGLSFLVLARVGTAVSAAAIIPLAMAWVGDQVHYERRQETLAQVGLGTMLGMAAGQLFGGLLTDTLGWRWAFAMMAVLFCLVSTLLWQHSKHIETPTDTFVATHGFFGQLLQIACDPWARTLLSIALLEGACVFGMLAVTASHLHHTHAISLTLAGGTTALFGVGGMLYMATAKYTIPRFGEVGLARYGGLAFGLSFLVIAFTPWWPLAIPACLLAGFGFAMFHNTMQAKATQMVPTARGTSVTLFAGALFFGQSLGVLVLANLMAYAESAQVLAWDALLVTGLAWYFGYALIHRNASQADQA